MCAILHVFASVRLAARERLVAGFQGRERQSHHAGLRYVAHFAFRDITNAYAALSQKRDGLQGEYEGVAAKRTLGGTSLRLSFFVFSRTAEYFAIPILACKDRMFWSNSQVPLHYFLRIFAAAFLIFSSSLTHSGRRAFRHFLFGTGYFSYRFPFFALSGICIYYRHLCIEF